MIRMIAVFLEGRAAVIEANAFFGERASLKPPPVSTRWSFYTASALASSSYAPEVRARLRLKSFGHESVHNAGDWHAMADGYEYKGMAATAVRSEASARDGF